MSRVNDCGHFRVSSVQGTHPPVPPASSAYSGSTRGANLIARAEYPEHQRRTTGRKQRQPPLPPPLLPVPAAPSGAVFFLKASISDGSALRLDTGGGRRRARRQD